MKEKKTIPPYVSESPNDVRDHLNETLSPAKRFRGTFGSWFPPEVSAPSLSSSGKSEMGVLVPPLRTCAVLKS
ncbi:hypothetical protein CDAR_368791 [Caerostris darwini]|uniref:Uncharacterized protein n=1 Tax=Caerostris darwini TaxID=1538125 RepID=A0AAV4WYX2_9ARAC|nr:hypothetical protein CDAR_368791 [Caerostris darwini]